jgi:hypothetical protein
MGKSHSKAGKSPTFVISEKAPLSPKQKREKLKKENDRKKQKKSSSMKKNSKLESLKTPRTSFISDRGEIHNETDLEVEIKRHMQDQLAFNSDIFVLNQMMMSVQFFANYERFASTSFNLSSLEKLLRDNLMALFCPSTFLNQIFSKPFWSLLGSD